MLTGHLSMGRANASNCFPLVFAARGQMVTLVEIRAGDKLRKRLADLGLNVGMRVRVVQGDSAGPVILAVKNDGRLAVGQGMAQKIMVRYAEGNE